MDESNQKRIHEVVAKFLYYAGAIDPAILISMKYLAEVQTKPTIETEKQITQFFNYSASHPESVIEYRRNGMILHIYSDASYKLPCRLS